MGSQLVWYLTIDGTLAVTFDQGPYRVLDLTEHASVENGSGTVSTDRHDGYMYTLS